MKKILIATELTAQQKDLVLKRLAATAEILFLDELEEGELEAAAASIHVILRYGGFKPFPDEVFRRMASLERVQLLCAGTDSVRRTETIPAHVQARGAIGANSVAVAEHAFALMLAAAKRLRERDGQMRRGVFDQKKATRCLAESTVGIVGLGSIGTEFARRAKAFGMQVLAINRRRESSVPVDFIGTLDDLDFLLSESDVVVLVLPLTDDTRNVIAAPQLALMREEASLVNVGRGGLVDEQALFDHLRAHPRFTACLDVWWSYPSLNEEVWYFEDRPYTQPFHQLENVLLTPHCAALSGDYRGRMLGTALDRLAEYLEENPQGEGARG
ncbi:2-hydroxyacid dehydrogenase [Candidatus Bipolaricaulota bacterium]